MVHTDLAGPVANESIDGSKYVQSFTDDYSNAVFVYFLKTKGDTVPATEKFLADTAPYGKVKCIRSDNGTEFMCRDFQTLFRKNGIKHETSAPYSPHQNGTAYLIYHPATEKIKKYGLVKFVNKVNVEKQTQTVGTEPNDDDDRVRQEVYESIEKSQKPKVRNKSPQGGTSDECDQEESSETSSESASGRYPKRERRKPSHLKDFVTYNSDSDGIHTTIDYC